MNKKMQTLCAYLLVPFTLFRDYSVGWRHVFRRNRPIYLYDVRDTGILRCPAVNPFGCLSDS